jgi:DNA-binding transcriptional MerR regulator/methylmalonyl-CoA mutase cobalamin-binding subunit
MPKGHPIAVVAERTGLSRDVIRAWERRYAVVKPSRTAGRQRSYSDADIARLGLLAAATRFGRNISQVAKLPSDEIAQLVADDEAARRTRVSVDGTRYDDLVARALALIAAFDDAGLDRELRQAISRDGLPSFLESLVPQLMERVGSAWQSGTLTIAHEHFASARVLAITLDAVRAVPNRPEARRLVVGTPARAQHAIGAALVAATATLHGWTVVHLGADVPAHDFCATVATTGADAVALSVIYTDDPKATERELRAVRAGLPARTPLILGGSAMHRLRHLGDEPGFQTLSTLSDLRGMLDASTAVA